MVATCDYLYNRACDSKCTFLLYFQSQPMSGWESSVTAETDLRNYQVRFLSNLVKDNSGFKRLICNKFYSANNGTNEDRILLQAMCI